MKAGTSATQSEPMQNSLVIVIAVVGILAGEALAGQPDQETYASTDVVTAQGPPPNKPTPSFVSVLIQNSQFSPNTITVAKGTPVTWTNMDSTPHTVTRPSEGGIQVAGPNSGLLNQGDTYTYTYNAVGFFDYHCSIHPSIHGTVEVRQ
jgi:plastocyanin